MDDYLKKQTLDKLSRARNIVIAITRDGNLDGLAAGLALYLSLKKVGKNVSVSAKDPNVGEARQLYAIDKIGGNQDKNDLLITVDNAIKNVDKVTYFLDKNKLKIVVHGLPNSSGISPNDISVDKTGSKPDLVFALGFQSLNDLRQSAFEQNIDPNSWIIGINAGNLGQKFAQVHFAEQSSSLSEVTTKVMRDFALPFDEDISFNLYAGIKFATDSFSPTLTGQATFEVAQYLLKFGAGKASLAGGQVRDRATLSTKELPKDEDKGDQLARPDSPVQDAPLYDEIVEGPIEQVEAKENLKESWLKPPKIYRGSKSFDRES